MGDSAAKPHDALFRHFIGRPSNAAARARPVVASALAARVDWSSLSLESISFVSRHLRGTYSDLLFSARFDGRDAFVPHLRFLLDDLTAVTVDEIYARPNTDACPAGAAEEGPGQPAP
ncbi:Rpn family recombination-promoting nuclease/putative transposase [Nocardia sp. FBN12]|uniref:Rpn family recombination-promoting nuclease/putative transposase n=1 Tax=Nocardia sp. FBN12 TaxID=3419766 RepID=UPI003D064837